jgi:hypothetical protein
MEEAEESRLSRDSALLGQKELQKEVEVRSTGCTCFASYIVYSVNKCSHIVCSDLVHSEFSFLFLPGVEGAFGLCPSSSKRLCVC